MHPTFNLFTGGWPLKSRLFQWPRPAPKSDGFAPKESSSNRLSRLLKPSHGSSRDDGVKTKYATKADSNSESWAYPPTLTANQAGGNTEHMASVSDTSCNNGEEPKGKQREANVGYGRQELDKVDLRADNTIIAGLQMLKSTNEHALRQTFELNLLRASLLKQLEDFIHSLQEFMGQVTNDLSAVDLSDSIKSQHRELLGKFESLTKGQFASLRADEARRTDFEDDIIQSLSRSGRYLNRLLQTNATEWVTTSDSDTKPWLTDNEDIREEVVERSPADIEYLSQVGDVDLKREQLTDLRSEQTRLLEEQDSRAHFGLSLDKDSLDFLQTFERQEQILLDELEYAEQCLDGLRQLIHDKEALQISTEASANEPEEDAGAIRHLEIPIMSESPSNPPATQAFQSPLYEALKYRKIRFADFLRGQQMVPMDPVDFINVWLLQRLQFLPKLLSMYTSAAEAQYYEIEPEDMEHPFLEKWFHDSTVAEFAKHRTFADQQSMQANLADSQDLDQRSVSAPSLRPVSVPLMKTGPSTTTNDIIAQAMQTQGIPLPRLPNN